MSPIRVFILASQTLFAQGVQSLLSDSPDIEVVGVAAPGADVLARAQAAAPDVVVIESRGEGQSILVAQLLDALPAARVVGLTLEDNRIHTYYQELKQGRRVEDLLEAIRGPLERYSRNPAELRLFVLLQGHYGQRILDTIRRYAPSGWTVNAWRVSGDLPMVLDDPAAHIPAHLPVADLLLALGESSSAAQLIPDLVERTGAQAVIAPIDNAAWLPDGLALQLRVRLAEMGVTVVFPKPFCSLTEQVYKTQRQEVTYEDPWISEFARRFGRPAFRITCDNGRIAGIEVERDAACGCARFVAAHLIGLDVSEAVVQAGLFHHHYPCLATMRVDPALGEPLIHIAGGFMRRAVETDIARSQLADQVSGHQFTQH